jgi:GTPase SAR1 family protein
VDARRLESALLELRHPIVAVPLALEAPCVQEARAERRKLLSQIDDYLLPRLRQSGAPILVALVGSTGAGKSTLMNSLVGKQVSATGIRRPTTNSPVLACHPDDAHWFAENVFLPTLPRVRQQGLAMPGRDGLLVLAAGEGMPQGVALLDTPDIDSVVEAHRQFAHQFLDASDLWLFMTSARRYADAAVWELLQDARDRGASLAIVLSRVPPAAAPQVTAHFDAMLEANGLTEIKRFLVPETVVTDAQLPAEVSSPVRDWLEDTADHMDRRVAVLTQTMSGVLDTFRARVPQLATEIETQLALGSELRGSVSAAYRAGLADLDQATRNGSLLSGEILARWQDFAGTGDLLRTLHVRKSRGPGRSRKRAVPARAKALKAALASGLEAVVVSLADRAAENAVSSWQAHPAGAALLAGQAGPGQAGPLWVGRPQQVTGLPADWLAEGAQFPPGTVAEVVAALARSSPDLAERSARAISAWQEHVLQLVRAENVTRRSIARVVSFDEEPLVLVLTIGVLGYGSGDGAAEGAGESLSAVPQQLLTSLFGAGLLRDIGTRMRMDLHDRISLLFDEEMLRFSVLVDSAGVPDETTPAQLHQANVTLEAAR